MSIAITHFSSSSRLGLDIYIHPTPPDNTEPVLHIVAFKPHVPVHSLPALHAPLTATMGSTERATASPTPSLLERHPREQTYTPVNLPPLDDGENAVIFEKRSSRRLRTMSLASFKSVPSLRAESRLSGGISLPASNATSPINTTFPPLTDVKPEKQSKEKDMHKIPIKPKPHVDNSFPASKVIAGPITGTLASPYPSFIGSARNPFEDYIETFAAPPDAVYDALPGGREAHCDLLAPDSTCIHDWSDMVQVRAFASRPRSRSYTVSLRSMTSTPDLVLPVRKHRPSPLGLASSSSIDIEVGKESSTLTKKKSTGSLKKVLKATRKSFTDLKALASRQSSEPGITCSPFDIQTKVPAVPPIPIAYWKQPNSICSSFSTSSTSSAFSSSSPSFASASTPSFETAEPVSPTSPTSAYSQLRPAISARSSYNSAYTAYTVSSSSEGVQTPATGGHLDRTELSAEVLAEALEDVQAGMQKDSTRQMGDMRRDPTSTLALPSIVTSLHSTPEINAPQQKRYNDVVVIRSPPPPRPRARGRSFTAPQLNWSAPLAGAHYATGASVAKPRARSQLEPSPIILPARAYRDQRRSFRLVRHP